MKLKYLFTAVGLCTGLLLTACSSHYVAPSSAVEVKAKMQPIIIQGALPVESEQMASKLTDVTIETVGGWKFWKGTYHGYPVIISKTRMGMSNSAAATAIAIERYQPVAIINQGTSGGHDPKLNVYDIVLGQYITNIGAFKTPHRPVGGGSDALTWNEAFDVLPKDESDPEPIAIRKFTADQGLMAAAQRVRSTYSKGKVVEGTIGSADVWNNELDRIKFFNTRYGTSVEEMEAASVAQIASQFNVPFIGIRVVSNNITNNGKYDGGTGEACQEYVLHVAEDYMKNLKAKTN